MDDPPLLPTSSPMMTRQIVDYNLDDQRPRYTCDGCQGLTSKNTNIIDDLVIHTCAKCGYITERKTENHEHTA